MPDREETITVRVTEDEKDQIDDYANSEDTRWKSVSDLLRGAAHREMSGEYLHDEIEEVLDAAEGADTDEIVESVEGSFAETRRKLEQMSSSIAKLETHLLHEEGTQQLGKRLRDDWLAHYPPDANPEDIKVTQEANTPEERWSLMGTAGAIAKGIDGRDKNEVKRALQYAHETYPDVRRVHIKIDDPDIDGLMRYYIEDASMSFESKEDIAEEMGEIPGFKSGSEYADEDEE